MQKLLFRSTGTMDQEQKWEAPCGIYTYKHHCSMGVDVHEIFVKKSSLRVVLSYIGVVFLLVNVSQPLLAKVNSLVSVDRENCEIFQEQSCYNSLVTDL